MPIYEYRCEVDGETITLMRPMADADDPVEDPSGNGRKFRRVHSTFSVGAGSAEAPMCHDGTCPRRGPDGSCGM